MAKTFTVWFYIGALLTLYGLLLTAAGIYQVSHPPATVLTGYHATLWVGVLLLLIGLGYLAAYWPRNRNSGKQHDGADIE